MKASPASTARWSARAAAALVSLVASSCGELVGPGFQGAALAELTVRWQVPAGASPAPAVELAVVWFGAVEPSRALERRSDPSQPTLVRARLDDVPPPSAFVIDAELTTAAGVLVAFADDDADGRLSFVGAGATGPDVVVGNAAFLSGALGLGRRLIIATGAADALQRRGLTKGLNVVTSAGALVDGGTLTLGIDPCLDQQWFARAEVVSTRASLDDGPLQLDAGCAP